jgi:dihydrofolate reductase
MSKVVLGMNVTLDGYVARTNGELDWMFPNIDAERTKSIVDGLREIDVFLMGRVTYEGMAGHWPTADDEIAPLMNSATKIVFSRTLSHVDWENCRLAKRDPAAEIAELKQRQGKTIAVAGGARLAQSLSKQRLIDEYNLTIHPVVLGTGLPLFTDPINLKLLTRSLQ